MTKASKARHAPRRRPTRSRHQDVCLQQCHTALAGVLDVPADTDGIASLWLGDCVAEVRRRIHSDPGLVVRLTTALQHAVDGHSRRAWWSGEEADDGPHAWFEAEPLLSYRLQIMRVLYEPLAESECAHAGASAGLPALLLDVLRAGEGVCGARWAAEAGLSIRCLAALSAYSTLRLELDDYLPLLCNELRKASQSCPAERLVDATSTQLHAVFCLSNYAEGEAGCRAVAASAAPAILKRLAAGGEAPSGEEGVVESHAANLLETLRPYMERAPAPAPAPARGARLQGGFGVPAKRVRASVEPAGN